MKTISNMISNNSEKDTYNQEGDLVSMDLLISNVKAEDEKNLRMTKSFLWIYIVLGIIYTLLIVVNPDPDIDINRRLSGFFYILSMLGFALLVRKGYKEFKNIDYSLPVIEMLRSAANRYRLSLKNYLLVSIPVILMDIGLTLSFYNDLLPMSPMNRILIVQAFYVPIMTISALIGTWIWYKKQKPLRDRALRLIKELEG